MKPPRPPFLILALLALTLGACKPNTLTQILVQSGGILYREQFNNREGGWGEMVSEAGAAGYADGAYRIVAQQPNVNIWSHPGLQFPNVQIETDLFPAAGPLENRMGLVCRLADNQNYYFFVISADGYYAIGKTKDGQAQILTGGGKMQPHPAIRTGRQPNRLRADCVEQFLILRVNDELVASVEDTELSSGDVGILAGTFSQPGADIYFDNFTLFQP